MSLVPGTRLGSYEILSLLGAGGMGEVYRARDTRLKREVAIKILPEAFAHDGDRLARFQREAELLATLNHPNIGAVFGLEQTEQSAGSGQTAFAIVLELIEGDTLADVLQRGPMPVERALNIARQIAEALEAAHEKGIVHRDLKPANIKITPEDKVKVLDFGLAKLTQAPDSGLQASDLSHSPTLSMMATQAGVVLGTAAYMSPEQAKGLPADQRSDVFAFGTVLYEMLTGRQPFQGDTAPDLLASVIVRDPDLNALPPNLNPRLRELLQRCLEKNPKKRWQAIGDVRAEIETIAASPHSTRVLVAVAPPRPLWRRALPFAVTAMVVAGVTGAGVWGVLKNAAPAPRAVTRFEIPLSNPLNIGTLQRIAISPDGRRIIYNSLNKNVAQVYSRSLDQLDPVPLQGLTSAAGGIGSIFLSPDGEWLGFNGPLGGSLRKVRLQGGPTATIAANLGSSGGFRGATWGAAGTIVFGTIANAGLMQVSDAGGVPTQLTTPKDEIHLHPYFLPTGRGLLYTVRAQGKPDRIAVVSLETSEQRLLTEGSSPRFAGSGHIVFLRESALWAVPFDLDRLELNGDAVPIVEGFRPAGPTGGLSDVFDLSVDGTLVYSRGGQAARSFVWVDRQGQETPINAPPRLYAVPRVSPDGSRIAVDSRDEENDIWIWNVRGETQTKFTLHPGQDFVPVWSRDGKRLAFGSDRDSTPGIWNVYWQSADQTGSAERLTTSANPQVPTSFSADGKNLVFRENLPGQGVSLSNLTLDATRSIQPLVHTPFAEQNGDISPDGRWLAYESSETGRAEIHVRPYPDASRTHFQVSTEGGVQPVWAPSGRELFYLAVDGALMSVPIQAGTAFAHRDAVKLFQGTYYQNQASRGYDVSPDGKRFLMIKEGPSSVNPTLIVVQNFFEELKQRVPAR